MTKIVIYSKEPCPYCHMAKEFFQARQLTFEEIRIDLQPEKLQEMVERSQKRTVPQIFINEQAIGGYDDLVALAKSGKLNDLL